MKDISAFGAFALVTGAIVTGSIIVYYVTDMLDKARNK